MDTKFDENSMISSHLNELTSDLKKIGCLKDLYRKISKS